MRLFVALPLPAEIAAAAFRLSPDLPALRRVRPELLHVTLAFLGVTDEDHLPDVAAAVGAAATEVTAFDVELDRIGRFPETGRPRMVWLGVGAGADRVTALGASVRAELDRREIAYDPKPLRAHVTLARLRDDADNVGARVVAAAVRSAPAPRLRYRVDAAVVFESVLSPKGPRYTARATASLRVGGKS